MFISVIIPTYNRLDQVQRALSSLCQQTLAAGEFEVVVIDDGSTWDLARLDSQSYPFPLTVARQENQGATAARNHGAKISWGDLLIFMDDDVTVSPPALAALAQVSARQKKVLALGTLVTRNDTGSPFARDAAALVNGDLDPASGDTYVHYTWCNTQLLAVKRCDYEALNGLQDPTGGWPNWDDVDFGVRANQAGYRIVRVADAAGEHWDASLDSLQKASRRWQRAARSAVRLFAVYPGLQSQIPMLADKTPVNWRQDGPRLVVRKIARRLASTSMVLWGMERGTAMLERTAPTSRLLRPLYRWIQGGYMTKGYREGLLDR